MLVFLSDYPTEKTQAHGMLQRVAAVDSIFAREPRVYLNIAMLGHIRHKARPVATVRVERLNFFLDFWHIRRLLSRARCVYVHSVYHFTPLLPFRRKLGKKIVLDLHGIVPEELAYLGRPCWSVIFGWVERQAASHAALLVTVTQKMAGHLLEKYSRNLDASRIVILPMLSSSAAQQPSHSGVGLGMDSPRLIYAGCLEKWQNIDRMLEILVRLAAVRPEICTWIYAPERDIPGLRKRVISLGLEHNVTLGYLPREQLLREYARFDAGFVLREDHILNRVAMPTKLFEYISYGVVPIVLSPDIGDFVELGYVYLRIEDLLSPEKLDRDNLHSMRIANARVLADIEQQTRRAVETLREFACVRKAASLTVAP
jgi:glycosyltransferase involved in cell wall biosynthesis